MRSGQRPRAPRPSEAEIVAAVAAHLENLGYRVRVNVDGIDYFDLVARREGEVGLVEAKVSDARTVLVQALKRRAWADWCAVALAGERSARRLAARTSGGRAEPVGVWCVRAGRVEVVRAPRPWVAPGVDDPFADLKARFRAILDALESGEIPSGVGWDGVVREVRRASGGRSFSEWRLDEPSSTGPPP
jgi:hypothetical protein